MGDLDGGRSIDGLRIGHDWTAVNLFFFFHFLRSDSILLRLASIHFSSGIGIGIGHRRIILRYPFLFSTLAVTFVFDSFVSPLSFWAHG